MTLAVFQDIAASRRRSSSLALLFLATTVGCSSEDSGGTTNNPGSGGEGSGGAASEPDGAAPVTPAELADTCGAGWVDACESADCDPSDALWSDCRLNGWTGYTAPELCAVDTGYPGDDMALCPPDPEDGFQLHFGPESYTDTEIQKHVIPTNDPSALNIACVWLPLPITEERFLGHLVGHVRPGMHHAQLRFDDAHAATSGTDSEFCLPFGGEFLHMGQQPKFQVPDLTVPSPSPGADSAGGLDFEGSALRMAPGRVLAVELHYINATTSDQLREGWFNFYYQQPDEVAAVLNGIMLIGTGINVAPGTTGFVRRSMDAPTARTITHLQGHSHVGTARFSIWVRRAVTGDLELVYESYDPSEPPLLTYSPLVDNPPANRETGISGGASGALHLDAGDALVWECEIENRGTAPIVDGGPNANGDQMCYTFGNYLADGDETAELWAGGATGPSPY